MAEQAFNPGGAAAIQRPKTPLRREGDPEPAEGDDGAGFVSSLRTRFVEYVHPVGRLIGNHFAVKGDVIEVAPDKEMSQAFVQNVKLFESQAGQLLQQGRLKWHRGPNFLTEGQRLVRVTPPTKEEVIESLGFRTASLPTPAKMGAEQSIAPRAKAGAM